MKPEAMSETFPIDRHLLIEASAGTGKTYTIVELYLRLITEKGLSVPEILVVTFTEKATGELKERIRERLRKALADNKKNDAKNSNNAETRERIEQALHDFASAPIYTIHGFCNSLLSEYAFEAGEPFQTEMADDSAIAEKLLPELFFQEAESWQQELTELVAKEEGLSEKEARVRAERLLYLLLEKSGLFTKNQDSGMPWFDTIQEARKKWSSHLRAELWPDSNPIKPIKKMLAVYKGKIDKIITNLGDLEKTKSQVSTIIENRNTKKLIHEKLPALWTLLDFAQFYATDHFIENVQSWFFDFTPTSTQRQKIEEKAPKLNIAINELHDFFANYIELIPKKFQSLTIKKLTQEIEAYKERHGLLSYNDMLKKVERACREPEFVRMVRGRFRHAIVDEFQDTDTIQWSIFRRLFLDDASGADFQTGDSQKRRLVLVGDPKQAIYAFRGADIYAYFEAKSVLKKIEENQTDVAQIQELDTNYRSTPELLGALNLLFEEGKGDWFLTPKFGNLQKKYSLLYKSIKPAKTGRKKSLSTEDLHASLGKKRAHLNILHFGPLDNPSKDVVALIRSRCYRFIASEIQGLVGRLRFADTEAANNGNDDTPPPLRFLRYKDIAILVRTKNEARVVQGYLDAAGIPNFRYKEMGLYESREALELELLLLAQKRPSDSKAVRAFLATSLGRFLVAREGWSAESALLNLQLHLEKWGRHLEYFHLPRYFTEVFSDTGLLDPLLEEAAGSSETNEARGPDNPKGAMQDSGLSGEPFDSSQRRLNFFQIREHLEEAALHGKKSLDALLHILAERKTQVTEELSLLRSNPEEDKVQILTFHVSKGLEFPVVFIAGGFSPASNQDKFHTFHEDAEKADMPLKADAKNKIGDANSNAPSNGTSPEKDGKDNLAPQRLIIDLTKSKNQDKYKQEKHEEFQRLMYVALTRAALMLYVPYYPKKTQKGKISEKSGPLSKIVAPAIENAFPKIFSQQTQSSQVNPKDTPKDDTKDLSENHTAFLQIDAFGQVEAINTEEVKEPRQALHGQKSQGKNNIKRSSISIKKEAGKAPSSELALTNGKSHKPRYLQSALPQIEGRYTPLDSFSGLKRRLSHHVPSFEEGLVLAALPESSTNAAEPKNAKPDFFDLPKDLVDEGEATDLPIEALRADSSGQAKLPEATLLQDLQAKEALQKGASHLQNLGGMAFGTLLHEILEKIDYSDIAKAKPAIQKKVEEFLTTQGPEHPSKEEAKRKKDKIKEITKEVSSLIEDVLGCPIFLPPNLPFDAKTAIPKEGQNIQFAQEAFQETEAKDKKSKKAKQKDAPLFEYAAKAANGHSFLLSQIPEQDRRHEVEFVFHKTELKDLLSSLDAQAVDRELGLLEKSGLYLRGSIDIVFRIGGRYFLADWKSNYSPNGYGREALEKIMQEHDYYLQRQIYCIALHRWLGFALPGYDFEKHFGGAYYFFLRGMKRQTRKSKAASEGVLFYRPRLAELSTA